MRVLSLRKVAVCVLTLLFVSTTVKVNIAANIPNPVLVFTRTEYVTIAGVEHTRYFYDVFNKEAFSAEMFAQSPNLPPCGSNTKASRTWVDIYDQRGKRLNGFCALGKPDDLSLIWFALKSDEIPPSWIYIELTDRQTNTKYKSNLAETTL